MDKPMLVFKRFGHQVHLMVQKEAKRCGIEFMGGPQGQVLRFLDRREHDQELTLIKDIEQELNITKSVASNLVKRMVQNGLVELEASPSDKRAKFVHLTEKSRSQMKQVKSFFDRIDRSLLEGVSEEKLAIFEEVLERLQANVEKIGGKNEETRYAYYRKRVGYDHSDCSLYLLLGLSRVRSTDLHFRNYCIDRNARDTVGCTLVTSY